jgi:positive regulator of sigma E activity
MKEYGVIEKIEGKTAVIRIVQQEDCKGCGACGASKPRTVSISAKDVKGLNPGDKVSVDVNTGIMMKAYGLIYAVPLAVFLVSIFSLHFLSFSPPISFAGAIITTFITYHFIGRYIKSRTEFTPQICSK